jgi:ABC-type bacteriocin/lantibiotic exporter with double-glycine peptidase domain
MRKNFFQNAFSLIPEAHFRKGFFITLLVFLGSLLDLISVASFLPLILLLINPTALSSSIYATHFIPTSTLADPHQLAIILTAAVMVLIVLKTLINSWIAYRKASYAYTVAQDLAAEALNKYLTISYIEFSHTDYTREMNRISNLPLTFANNFIIPVGTIIAEGFLAFCLSSLVAVYDFHAFIFLLTLLTPLFLVSQLKKARIKKTSNEIKLTYPTLLKYTLQAVEGLLEMKAFQKESFFKQRFFDTYKKLGKIFSTDHVLSTSTARTTELIAAFGIGALIVYSILSGKPNQESMLLLSVYAGVSFRIIPSLNRIFAAIMQIRTHEYAVEELDQLINRGPEEPIFSDIPSVIFNEKLELRNITFGYSGHQTILKNVSLTIRKGERIVITGKSGSGKTTLFLVLMRFLKEQSGELSLDGKKLNEKQLLAMRRHVGYVPQSPYLLDASIVENIAFGVTPDLIDIEKVNSILQQLDLTTWIQQLPQQLNTILGERGTKISGGQRQRIAIARALYHNAEIFLLDEITNQLDRETEQEVLRAINILVEKRKTIIFITHKTALAGNFDTAYELSNGNLEAIAPTVNLR